MKKQPERTPCRPQTKTPPQPPFVDEALVRWLEAAYPARMPHPAMEDRQIWREVGQCEVVACLRLLLQKQRNEH